MREAEFEFNVVVPVHGRADWAELAFAALRNFSRHPYQLIVVDNASPDDATKKLLERVKEQEFGPAKVLHLAENKSFSNSVNAGIRAGRAPNVVILNSDALVTPGWDSCFLQDLADKHVGMTGARSNAASGLQSDSTGLADVIEARYLVFVCVAMRREIFEKVGPLDEKNFTGWSNEDLDMSFRIRYAIKDGADPKVVIANKTEPSLKLKISNAYVLHGLSQTLEKTVGGIDARRANDLKYQARLVEKWGLDFVREQLRPRPIAFVASFSAEEMTRVQFTKQLIGLRRSTTFDFTYGHLTRLPIHLARQTICEEVMKQENVDWLFMIDDDMTFPTDLLTRMITHNVDVVSALAYGRKHPFTTCVYTVEADNLHGTEMVGLEHTGLRKVDITGYAVSCIKVDMLRKLRAKGVKEFFAFRECGEDFFFSRVLRDNEIPIHVDTDLIVGHVSDAVVVDEAYKRAWLAAQPKA